MTLMLYILLCLYQLSLPNLLTAKRNLCRHYPDPKHGHMLCDHLIGKYCTPQCHAGYELATTPAWAYICNPSSKKWTTYPENYPLPWPDCVRDSNSVSRSVGDSLVEPLPSHEISNEDMQTPLHSFLNAASDPNYLNFVLERANEPLVHEMVNKKNESTNNLHSNTKPLFQKTFARHIIQNRPDGEIHNAPYHGRPNYMHSVEKYSTIFHKNKRSGYDEGIESKERSIRSQVQSKMSNLDQMAIDAINCDPEDDDGAAKSSADGEEDEQSDEYISNCINKDVKTNIGDDGVDNQRSKVDRSHRKTLTDRPTEFPVHEPPSEVSESAGRSSDLVSRHHISKKKRKKVHLSNVRRNGRRYYVGGGNSNLLDLKQPINIIDKHVSQSAKKENIGANRLPLVPVFSVDDLDLLRSIVSKFKTKRSRLTQESSSLWSKMMKITSKYNSKRASGKPQLLSRKQLAFKDSDLAKLIMSDVNKARSYHFRHKINPVIFNEIAKRLKHPRYKTGKPYARQYVFNGATFVPVPENEKPASFLNSLKGGGLTDESTYRWNGATFVKVRSDDNKSENEINLENPKEEEKDEGQYVYNGATFVALPKNKQPASFLNNNKGGGLSPESKYHWNGATIVTSDPKDSSINPTDGSDTLPKDFTSNDVQKILEKWNNEDQGQKQSDDANKLDVMKSPTDPKTVQATFNPYLPTQYPSVTPPSNFASSLANRNKEDELYYWNGVKYEPVKSVPILPVGTMRYKKLNGIFEQVDIVTDTTYANEGKTHNDIIGNDAQSSNIAKHENSGKNSGIESRTRFVWNGATFVPIDGESNDNKNTLSNQLFQWTGHEFIPATNGDTKIKQLYQWDGNNFIPFIPPAESTTSPLTTLKIKSNVENILQSHYPTPPSINHAQGTNGAIISQEKPIDATSDIIGSEPAKSKDLFQAKISSPDPLTGKVPDVNNTFQGNELSSEVTTTAVQINTTKSNIIIPPPNPYLSSSITQSDSNDFQKNNDNQSKNNVDSTTTAAPHENHPTVNPFKEDEENLESAINNDLGIKNELEDLSKIYANSPDSAPVNIPITHKESIPDLKLLDPSAFTTPKMKTTTPSIDNELDDDVLKKSPDTLESQEDIDAADHLIRSEEEKHRNYGPTASVRSESDIAAAEELKAALRKIELKEKMLGVSDESAKKSASGEFSSTNLIDSLSSNAKNKLEKSLQEDMEKLTSTDKTVPLSLSVSDPSDVTSGAKGISDESKPEDSGYSGLNVADLRALLDITRLAEKQALAKKFGLTRPNLYHLEAAKILRKRNVRHFLKYLLRRHEFSKALKQVKYLGEMNKQQKDLSKKKSDTQSIKSLMAHYKLQKGALPKFSGKRSFLSYAWFP